MRAVVTPGAWYQDARLDGQYIASVVGSHLDSAQGRIERPNGIDILFPRVPRLGPFKFAGQSSVTNGPNLEYIDGVFHDRLAHSYGVNPVIYRNNGTLLENEVALGYGSQGFRFVDDPIGRVWTGDETYADPARRFWEWTRLYGYTAGRVPVTNATDRIVIELPDGERRMIADEGRYLPNSIHYDTDGVDHVITYTDQDQQKGVILWFTTLELVTQFPLEPSTQPEPEPERPTCTITSYSERITEGDPCVVHASYGGGPITEARWLYRSLGETMWILAHEGPAIPSFDYGPEFETWGTFEISLMVEGPGGSDETASQRIVHVDEKQDPEPEPQPMRTNVAFGPNLGSLDFQQLFTESDRWQWSYDRISTFQCYQGHIGPIGVDLGERFCQPNTFDNLVEAQLFSKLKAAGILLELQMTGGMGPDVVQQLADRIATIGGGRLGAVCYDNLFAEVSAIQFAETVRGLRQLFPSLIIGAYCAYPMASVSHIRERLAVWDQFGGRPDFLRLDIDPNPTERAKYTAGIHQEIRDLCAPRGMTLQTVINAQDGISDAQWVRDGKAWFDRAKTLGFDALIVQSWATTPSEEARQLPINLPEEGDASHCALLRYCLERFS